VIGNQWLTVSDAKGGRRLDSPDDFVRIEIEAALERAAQHHDVRVVPTRVEGAEMPRAEDLPEPLAGLAHRNAFELTDARWPYDAGRLITWLKQLERLKASTAEANAADEAHLLKEPAAAEAQPQQGRREREMVGDESVRRVQDEHRGRVTVSRRDKSEAAKLAERKGPPAAGAQAPPRASAATQWLSMLRAIAAAARRRWRWVVPAVVVVVAGATAITVWAAYRPGDEWVPPPAPPSQDADADGVLDFNDPFALDPKNGLATKLPVTHRFNSQRARDPFDLGFTGVMANSSGEYYTNQGYSELGPGTSYRQFFAPANVLIGQGVLRLRQRTARTAFQFGIDPDRGTVFTARTRLSTHNKSAWPGAGQRAGLVVGTGKSGNHAELVLTSVDEERVIRFRKVVPGEDTELLSGPLLLSSLEWIDLYLTLGRTGPLGPWIEALYRTSAADGCLRTLGKRPAPDIWFNGTAGEKKRKVGLAIGVIAGNTSSSPFLPRWSLITVRAGQPALPNCANDVAASTTITVPDVFGDDEQTATRILKEAGFTVAVNTVKTSQPSREGVVLAQQPTSDTRAERGAQVTISIGKSD
jgi:hypothetical protein